MKKLSTSQKKTIAVIVGTRPEAIKLAPVIRSLQESDSLQPFTISTSQHAEMTAQIFNSFGITPDLDLRVMRPRQSLWDLTASLSTTLGQVFSGNRFDAVLVQGDTTSAFVGGLCAFYHKIPVGHVEAGLRSHNRYSPFPEELNRVMLSRLADWHFAPTEFSASLLRAENIPDESIFISGNTVVDALQWMIQHSRNSDLPAGVPENRRQLILVTCHRRENIGVPMRSVALAIKHLSEKHPGVHFLFPLHPNPSVRENVLPLLSNQPGITLCEPLNHEEFLSALRQSRFVLSDSGGVQEEATALGKPVLVLRRETERPEGVTAGTLRLIGTDVQDVIRETENLLANPVAYEAMTNGSNVFGDGHAAEHITRILEEKLTPPISARTFESKAELVLLH
jgi:UDP-N-acetylglucosamine 2-epimerase (non-hydrolysing)